MAVNVGSAVGYLDLDISGFITGLTTAQTQANTKTKNMVTQVGNNVTALGQKFTAAGTALTTTVTLPILALGTAAVKTTSNFESAMSKVSAISGATGSDLEALSQKAQQMGATTKFTASEAASAFTYMAMAGWKTEDMLAGIEGIMSLAAADGLDLATTSDIVTDALTAFGLSADDSSHFADVLAKASSSANTNVSMLGESFKYVAPVAGSLGYSIEDVGIALGLMANSGIKGSQAGTTLRQSLNNLIKPTDDAAAMMKKYGIEIANADGSMKPLGDVMDMLRNKLGGLSAEEQAVAASTLFGTRSMAGMLAIINASDSDYQGLTDSIYGADGAAKDMANTMLNNLNGQVTLLKSALEGLAIQLGEILLPYIKQFVSWVQSLVVKLQNLTPEQKEQVVRWAAIAASIGPALLIFGKVITVVGNMITLFGKVPGAINKLSTGILNLTTATNASATGTAAATASSKGFGAAIKGLGSALASVPPIVWIVIAIIAVLTAAFVTLWKTNEEFRNKVIAIWEEVKQTFADFGKEIVEKINSLGFDFSSFGELMKTIWLALCDFLEPLIIGLFNDILTAIKTTLDLILNIVGFFVSILKGDWQGAWNSIKGIFLTIWDSIVALLKNNLNVIREQIDVVLGWCGTSWNEVWTSIKNFFVNIWNNITTWFQTALNNIATFFSNIWNGIVSFFMNTWETIKNIVTVGIMFIVELIKAWFNLVTLPFRFIWENCKDTIISIWESIKAFISNALTSIQTTITNVWNSVKNFFISVWTSISTFVSTIWNGIKSVITTIINAISAVITSVFNSIKTFIVNIWNGIKTTITNVVNGINTTVTNVFNAIKTFVTNVWNAIKSAITSPINSAKETISSVIDTIKNKISSGFNSAKDTVSSVFNSIKNSISGVMDNVKNVVQNAIDTIRSKFNFSWSLPKLKMPHFRISGEFSLNPPSVPSFGIEWYKKAMGNGMILDTATIFGFNSKTGKFLAGGEAGSETVVGTKSLLKMIKQAVYEAIGPLVLASRELARASGELGYVTYNGFTKLKEAKEKQDRMGRDNVGSGDTFIFHSPKPIDEIEAAKQMKKTKRELAEGF